MKDDKPIKQRYYPRNPAQQAIINKKVDELLAKGLIEPANSPYSSPVVLVREKNIQRRMCIDYRQINTQSIPDEYPLPRRKKKKKQTKKKKKIFFRSLLLSLHPHSTSFFTFFFHPHHIPRHHTYKTQTFTHHITTHHLISFSFQPKDTHFKTTMARCRQQIIELNNQRRTTIHIEPPITPRQYRRKTPKKTTTTKCARVAINKKNQKKPTKAESGKAVLDPLEELKIFFASITDSEDETPKTPGRNIITSPAKPPQDEPDYNFPEYHMPWIEDENDEEILVSIFGETQAGFQVTPDTKPTDPQPNADKEDILNQDIIDTDPQTTTKKNDETTTTEGTKILIPEEQWPMEIREKLGTLHNENAWKKRYHFTRTFGEYRYRIFMKPNGINVYKLT